MGKNLKQPEIEVTCYLCQGKMAFDKKAYEEEVLSYVCEKCRTNVDFGNIEGLSNDIVLQGVGSYNKFAKSKTITNESLNQAIQKQEIKRGKEKVG